MKSFLKNKRTSDSSTEPYASRVTLVNGRDIRFSKVTRVDNGDYICEVSSAQSPYQAATVKLTVLGICPF